MFTEQIVRRTFFPSLLRKRLRLALKFSALLALSSESGAAINNLHKPLKKSLIYKGNIWPRVSVNLKQSAESTIQSRGCDHQRLGLTNLSCTVHAVARTVSLTDHVHTYPTISPVCPARNRAQWSYMCNRCTPPVVMHGNYTSHEHADSVHREYRALYGTLHQNVVT